MKKVLIAAAVLVCFGFMSSKSTSVYICDSPNAKKYHFNKNCSGLQKCTHTIKAVTKEEATKLGYTVCLKE